MKSSRRPGILAGLLVGALLTAALTGVLYAAWQLAGLPFVAYDMFDWLGRVLPGRLVTFGIDNMVAAIRTLQVGPTSAVAKLAEHLLAILNLFLAGIVVGGLQFWIVRARDGRNAVISGMVAGLLLAIPALLVSASIGQTSELPRIWGAIWILVAFVGWGACLGWSYKRLAGPMLPAGAEAQASAVSEQPIVHPIGRRQFLIRLGAATAVITVAGAVIGRAFELQRKRMMAAGAMRWSASHPLPNADAALQPAAGTRSEFTPLEQHYRIDINTTPRIIDPAKWRLAIGGLVAQPRAFTLEELKRYEPLRQFITLACISNPVGGDLISTTRWTGVSLKRLLPDLQLKPDATHLKLTSADGFWEILPLDVARADERVMLAYAWDGLPLTAEHGFPLRVYIPDHYGMKQPKWIESIDATDHWEPGYWVVRGWDKEANMKATAVIDTIAINMMIIHANQQTLVPIGGIAHAGARGISKVELRVDDGPWREAQLRRPLSELTWVIWRYDWPFQPGTHTWTVRCYDGQGIVQIETPAPPHPSGATGLHSRTQML